MYFYYTVILKARLSILLISLKPTFQISKCLMTHSRIHLQTLKSIKLINIDLAFLTYKFPLIKASTNEPANSLTGNQNFLPINIFRINRVPLYV